jgi:hypothetical protein
MHVHCSACGTPLASGHGFCSGCGLQLTAHAVPTPAPRKLRRQPLLPMWAWIAIALMILVALATTSSQHAEQAREQTIAAFKADLFDNGVLATPEAFSARCGQPQTVLHPTSGQYKGDTVLSYQGGAIHVHFHPGEKVALRAVQLEEDRPGHYREWEALTDESIVFDHLQCKAAQ